MLLLVSSRPRDFSISRQFWASRFSCRFLVSSRVSKFKPKWVFYGMKLLKIIFFTKIFRNILSFEAPKTITLPKQEIAICLNNFKINIKFHNCTFTYVYHEKFSRKTRRDFSKNELLVSRFSILSRDEKNSNTKPEGLLSASE